MSWYRDGHIYSPHCVIMKTLRTALIPTLVAATLVLSPAAAFADSDSGSSSTPSSERAAPAAEQAINSVEAQQEALAQVAPDQLPAIKARAAEKIAKRQSDLTQWSAKVATAPADCGQNAAVLARIAATQTSLLTLNNAIQASTTPEAAKPLYQQIFTHNRVYAVVSPVVHLTLACDNQWARAAKQTAAIADLQAKITAATATGVNTAAASALLAQVAPLVAAGKQSALLASTGVASLVPDQGNEATKATNTAAITAARGLIKQADAQLDGAASLLTQTRKALGLEVNTEKKETKKAEREAEKAKKEAEKAAEKAKRQADKAAKKANKKNNDNDNDND
jgi:hypothetical protein